eukprot:TRINITY_DN724_c0_g1_i1.p1 TRINITY_DN724_c0_g1~~TRINITY_DN724_c0_g1_i1.p1  ORF type:complete len:353 (-),score=127.29 TRINITY_DN724_c0_g1_i1:138-1196(-)
MTKKLFVSNTAWGRTYGYSSDVPLEEGGGCSPFWKSKYKDDGSRYWDMYYRECETRAYKDRHYLFLEFPELTADVCSSEAVVLEVGCGVGNSLFPLLMGNPHLRFRSFDFSRRAIGEMEASEGFDSSRCDAYVYDATCGWDGRCTCKRTHVTTATSSSSASSVSSSLPSPSSPSSSSSPPSPSSSSSSPPSPSSSSSSPPSPSSPSSPSSPASTSTCTNPICDLLFSPCSADFALAVFTLSAMAPEKMAYTVRRIGKALKPGGMFLFRDYGDGDMAQVRFLKDAASKCVEKSLYVRNAGTLAYFFTIDFCTELFTLAGFRVARLEYLHRVVENKKLKLTMNRIFIQGVFVKE